MKISKNRIGQNGEEGTRNYLLSCKYVHDNKKIE